MSKTIKFNLMIDGKGIRSIDELKENFNISDILNHYESGMLCRWLEVREYNEYANKIKYIDPLASLEEKVKFLFEAFDFSSDDENAKYAISALLHTKEREKTLKDVSINDDAEVKIISDYISDYEKLKFDIKTHKNDDGFIHIATSELENKFFPLFKLNCIDVYEELKEILPFVIEKMVKNNSIINELNNTSIKKDIDYAVLKNELKTNATNLATIKKLVDKIANDYLLQFKQDYEHFFCEIKDSYPLIVYGLLMNQKTQDYLLLGKLKHNDCEHNRQELLHDYSEFTTVGLDILKKFSRPSENIDNETLQYFKQIPKPKKEATSFKKESEKNVLLIYSKHVTVRETPNGCGTQLKIEEYGGSQAFIILKGLQVKPLVSGRLTYIEIPDNNDKTETQDETSLYKKIAEKQLKTTPNIWESLFENHKFDADYFIKGKI